MQETRLTYVPWVLSNSQIKDSDSQCKKSLRHKRTKTRGTTFISTNTEFLYLWTLNLNNDSDKPSLATISSLKKLKSYLQNRQHKGFQLSPLSCYFLLNLQFSKKLYSSTYLIEFPIMLTNFYSSLSLLLKYQFTYDNILLYKFCQ